MKTIQTKLLRFAIIISSLVTSQLSFGQNGYAGHVVTIDQPDNHDDIVWESIKNQPDFAALDRQSQEVLYWANFARMYPRKFYDEYAAPYIKKSWGLANPYCASLKECLYNADPAAPLQANRQLTRASYNHAMDLKGNQLFQHASSNGQSFQQRILYYIPSVKAAENIHNGIGSTPFGAIMSFLVDDGIPSLGHRKTLLNPEMLNVGIAFIPYDSYSALVVQDFCGKL